MRIINQNESVQAVEQGIRDKSMCVLVEYTAPQVNYGVDDIPNIGYCQQNNIDCVFIGRRGGAFYISKGDISFAYICEGLNNSMGLKLHNGFVEFLKLRGLETSCAGNDILVNNYKVFGWSSNYYKEQNVIFITAHFTLNVDIDLIKNICLKPMVKIPKGLNSFGVNAEDIKEFVKNILSKDGK